jgi:hypothetical protein
MLVNLGALELLGRNPNVVVLCRDNIPSQVLKVACEQFGVHYIANEKPMGFAANNNANFAYMRDNLGMQEHDFFMLMNPDISIDKENLDALLREVEHTESSFLVPNLKLDRTGILQDDNIRTYPSFLDFFLGYCFKKRLTMVNRSKGLTFNQPYWASCSFMLVRAELYKVCHGLDERFYLYCEDIDFSRRLALKGITFTYLKDVIAIHFRQRSSQQLLSRFFWWHFSGVLKYCFLKYRFTARYSLLKNTEK